MRLLVAILILLICIPAHSQDPYQYFRQYDFSGGVNYFTSPFMLKDNESPDMENVIVTKEGAIEKRSGYTLHSSFVSGTDSTTIAESIHRYYDDNGNGEWLAHTSDGKIYNATASTWNVLDSTASTTETRFANFVGKVYWTNTEDGLFSYDGSTTASVSTAPKCAYIAVHGQRMYLAGNPSNPQTLYYCDIYDATTWDNVTLAGANAGYYRLLTPDGSAITGIAEWKDYLLIFTKSAIMALQGNYPDDQSFITMSTSIGCTAPKSIVPMADTLAFKCKKDFYVMGNPPTKISDRLTGQITDCTSSVGLVYDRWLWFSEPGADELMEETQSVYIYEFNRDRWMRFSNIPIKCGYVANGPGDDQVFLFCDSKADRVYQWDPTVYRDELDRDADGDYTYECYYYTKKYTFGAPEHVKVFRHIQADTTTTTGTYQLSYNIDNGRIDDSFSGTVTAGARLGTLVLGVTQLGSGLNAVLAYIFKAGDMGKVLQLRWYSSGVNDILDVYGFALRFRPKPFRGGLDLQ